MKIEFILRESTIEDVIASWELSGHKDNSGDGGFSFDDASGYEIKDGFIHIGMPEDALYIYKMSDFYRIKISYPS